MLQSWLWISPTENPVHMTAFDTELGRQFRTESVSHSASKTNSASNSNEWESRAIVHIVNYAADISAANVKSALRKQKK